MPELMGKPDENSFEAPDVAAPLDVFVPGHFASIAVAAATGSADRILMTVGDPIFIAPNAGSKTRHEAASA